MIQHRAIEKNARILGKAREWKSAVKIEKLSEKTTGDA
jgi:hypothetical protein